LTASAAGASNGPMSWWWIDEFNLGLLAITLAAAIRWGEAPERLCLAVLLGMPSLDALYHFTVGRGAFYESVDVGHFVMDALAAVALLFIAVNANRIYPLWIAAFQSISVLAHFAREVSAAVAALAYAYLAYAPFYLEAATLLLGIGLHANRVRRTGRYRSWRSSLSHSSAPALTR
jgi:hypothetical protein